MVAMEDGEWVKADIAENMYKALCHVVEAYTKPSKYTRMTALDIAITETIEVLKKARGE